jgi:cytochrome o ubiquinol oxidase operon protein cyoD
MSRAVISRHDAAPGNFKSYTWGFGLSLVLTVVAYVLTVKGLLSGWGLIYTLAGLAIAQLFVQLWFFLHLGRESKPRWNLAVLVFAAGVVFIVVFGSLWIMKNLDYNHHHGGRSPQATNKFLIKDEGY